MIGFRHQLAAYSPIDLTACLAATRAAAHVRGDPRPALVELLQREYAADGVLLCGSGTQALQVGIDLAAQERGSGAQIALPAYTCYDVASAAVGANRPLLLYDVDPESLAPNLGSLERALSAGATIVVVAPSYGVPVDWKPISALADAYGAVLIEDAAQCHGARIGERLVGTLASISVLSFGRGKGWTGGRGGAVLLRGSGREGIRQRLVDGPESDASVAISLYAQWALGRPTMYGVPRSIPRLQLGVTVYHDPQRPRLMTRAAAAALLSNYESATREADIRRAAAALYTECLNHIPGTGLARVPDRAMAGYIRFPVRICGGLPVSTPQPGRGSELTDDVRRLGIERGYPMSIAKLPAVANRRSGGDASWAGADQLVAEIVTLPTHSQISVPDRKKIVAQWDVGGQFFRG